MCKGIPKLASVTCSQKLRTLSGISLSKIFSQHIKKSITNI